MAVCSAIAKWTWGWPSTGGNWGRIVTAKSAKVSESNAAELRNLFSAWVSIDNLEEECIWLCIRAVLNTPLLHVCIVHES